MSFRLPNDYPRIKRVNSFEELVGTQFEDGVNALCWERTLAGDYAEVVAKLEGGEEIVMLEETILRGLPVSAAGRAAVDQMLGDYELLLRQNRNPVLNCITAYPRDTGAVPTDVYSFHADSAPVEADTFLCTYHGAPSEGLRNEEARRRIEVPETRAELLKEFGGEDGEEFREFLKENCYDLHYVPNATARPFSFGVGNFWRIVVDYPNSPVPPCIHRAPLERAGEARLLLIS